MTNLTEPLGRLLVIDIETSPDPLSVAIAGRGDQINRTALHRLVAYSMLEAKEDAQGNWGEFDLSSGADQAELPMLVAISDKLQGLYTDAGTLITFNGLAHDLPALRRRLLANWAFDLEGLVRADELDHIDLMRSGAGGAHGKWSNLRDSCAGLGIPLNHLIGPRSADPLASSIRKSQTDVVGTLLLLLHEVALARRHAKPLAAGWRALSDHLGRAGGKAPHLEQFRMPALLGVGG